MLFGRELYIYVNRLFHNILTFYYQSNRPVRRTILSLFLLVNLVFCHLTWLWRHFFCVWHSGRCVCVTSTRRVISLWALRFKGTFFRF